MVAVRHHGAGLLARPSHLRLRAQLPAFQYGSSTALSAAADVHASGYGVCRDFTHLAISLCRALNIPARYVFGYLPEIQVSAKPQPMDFAAWMEVWLGTAGGPSTPATTSAVRAGCSSAGAATPATLATTFGAPYLRDLDVVAELAPASDPVGQR